MTIKEIFDRTEHRPWKIPSDDWKFYQEWNNAIFLHWQVELEELKKFVPKELEIDLFEGKPWVSLVAFTMENIRPKYLPAFPPISNFEEINIRTYVKSKEKTGVYFLSIEAGSKISSKIAKSISELPYRYSSINREENILEALNKQYDDILNIKYSLGRDLINKTKLDRWLTERYALFQDTVNTINEFEIHHLEWPINEINITTLDLNYSRFHKLLNNKPKIVHYSRGVKVIAWGKNKLLLSSNRI